MQHVAPQVHAPYAASEQNEGEGGKITPKVKRPRGRPKRNSDVTQADISNQSSPPKKRNTSGGSNENKNKSKADQPKIKRGRGRPKKCKTEPGAKKIKTEPGEVLPGPGGDQVQSLEQVQFEDHTVS